MDSALIDQTSEQYLGQWKRLVSTTNWEKGQIIHAWREALVASDAPGSEYSDEAWSRRVGNVTPQHVGRLRRAFERFGGTRDDYDGLFWSHFQAALDWDDAEMWLEGAVQNGWSISEMRYQRWQVQGVLNGEEPQTQDVAVDVNPWDDDAEPDDSAAEVTGGTRGVVQAPEGSDASADDEPGYDHEQFDGDAEAADRQRPEATTAREIVRPFASLPPLPVDVNDAFESYKLTILRHKLTGWAEISRTDMLASLDALKELALAPAGE